MSRIQCLLFVVREEQASDSKQSINFSSSGKIKGYVLCPSVGLKKQSAYFNFFKVNGVKILSKQNTPSLQSALDRGQVEIIELIITKFKNSRRRQVSIEAGNNELVSSIFSRHVIVRKMDINSSNKFCILDKGNVETIVRLLTNKPDHMYKNPRGGTLLHLAVIRSNLDLIKALLKIGANVEAKKINGSTALHIAVQKENAKIVSFLLESGASIDVRKDDGSTCLLTAIERDCVDIVRLLLANGASVEVENNEGYTPIHTALLNGSVPIVKDLLLHGASANTPIGPLTGKTLLWFAVDHKFFDIALLLLRYGADVNTQRAGLTVLYMAAKEGCLPVTEFILKQQPDRHIESNKKALRQLVLGCDKNSNKLTKLMLEQGFAVDEKDVTDSEFLVKAVFRNHSEVVAQLLSRGANVNVQFTGNQGPLRYRNGITPLHLAVTCADRATVELLLQHGADVNINDGRNLTPIHVAIEACQTDIVNMFLENNVYVASFFDYLCYAAEKSNVEIVIAFLLKGTMPDDENSQLRNLPLAAAVSGGKPEIVKLLLKYCVHVDFRNVENETVLHVASHKGFIDIVRILIGHNANIELESTVGKTPILKAIEGGHIDVVRLLLKLGATIDFGDYYSKAAIRTIAENGLTEVFEAILPHNFTNIDCDSMTEIRKYLDLARMFRSSFFFFVPWSRAERENEKSVNKCFKICYDHSIKALEANIFNDSKQEFPISYLLNDGGTELAQKCRVEIGCMKGQYFDGHEITFYNILTANEGQLARFMRLKSVRDAFQAKTFLWTYPQYGSILECHFEKGLRRKELLEHSIKAAKKSSELFAETPYEVVETIFDYVSNKDIEWLVHASVRLKIADQDYSANL